MTDCLIRPAAEADYAAATEIYNHYVVNSAVTFDLEPPGQHAGLVRDKIEFHRLLLTGFQGDRGAGDFPIVDVRRSVVLPF